MSGTTSVEGYPYPNTTDFADVQDPYQLAVAVDADLRSKRAAFAGYLGRPSFIYRNSLIGTSFTSGTIVPCTFDVVEWDNTSGAGTQGGTAFSQPFSPAPEWWMFGLNLNLSIVSGTPAVGDLNLGQIQIATTDQVSGVQTTTSYYQRNDDTNTAGERIFLFAFAPIYHGVVTPLLSLNGSATKAAAAGGCRFWGMKLGAVT